MFHPQSPGHPQEPPTQNVPRSFKIHYGLSILYIVIFMLLVIIWSTGYQGGFNTQWIQGRWNTHHLLMLFGMLVFNGNAILIFRVGRNWSKQIVTIIHVLLNVIGFAIAIGGLELVFSVRRDLSVGNHMNNLHSWLGIIAVLFFAIQFVGGFLAHFPTPILSSECRQKMASAHRKVGILIFTLSTVTVLTGLTLRASSIMSSIFVGENYFINFTGLFIACFSITVVSLLAYPKYKRKSEN